ncbi:hypothetical protein Vic_00011 [Mycolicibacterium phage Vic9]
MTIDVLAWLVVYALAAARVTRLINFDAVLDRPRVALVQLVRGNPVVVYFIRCPWCVGFWVTLATAWIPLWHWDNRAFQFIAVALAVSHLIGIAAPLSADDDSDVEVADDDEL